VVEVEGVEGAQLGDGLDARGAEQAVGVEDEGAEVREGVEVGEVRVAPDEQAAAAHQAQAEARELGEGGDGLQGVGEGEGVDGEVAEARAGRGREGEVRVGEAGLAGDVDAGDAEEGAVAGLEEGAHDVARDGAVQVADLREPGVEALAVRAMRGVQYVLCDNAGDWQRRHTAADSGADSAAGLPKCKSVLFAQLAGDEQDNFCAERFQAVWSFMSGTCDGGSTLNKCVLYNGWSTVSNHLAIQPASTD
jgi:hypothetical protein